MASHCELSVTSKASNFDVFVVRRFIRKDRVSERKDFQEHSRSRTSEQSLLVLPLSFLVLIHFNFN